MMKRILAFILFFLMLSCKAQDAVGSSQKQLPNILFIHTDDLGYYDLGFNGSQIYQTPNVDGLSQESIVFTNAHANYPRCVPSRYSMMTGTYPLQDGEVPDDGFRMDEINDTENLIKHIDAAGYHTAFFGKWHLGDGPSGPEAFGFDFSLAAGEAGSPISYFYPFNVPTRKNAKVRKPKMKDMDSIGREGDYLTDLMTTQVIKYMQEIDKSQPFMVELAFYAVHQPIEAKPEDVDRNKKQIAAFDFGDQPEYIPEGTGRTKMRQDNPVYAGMVENMDRNVGRLLETLKELGIEKNTIVVFSSDHGGLSNDGTHQRHLATSNYPLRAGKGWMYEGGTKVPLLLRWPGHFKHRKEESLVMLMDLYPTILDLVSGEKLSGIDGKSFKPVIQEKEKWNDRTVFWHSDKARPRNTGEMNSSAVRSGKWKLIDFYEEGRKELYDLSQDIGEQEDLSHRYPEKVKELSKLLDDWKRKHL